MKRLFLVAIAVSLASIILIGASSNAFEFRSSESNTTASSNVTVYLSTEPWAYYSGLDGRSNANGVWLVTGTSGSQMSWNLTTSSINLNDPATGFSGEPTSSSQGSLSAYESDVQYEESNYAGDISGASSLYSVPTDLIYAIMLVESSGGQGGGNVMQEGAYTGSFTAANGVTYTGSTASIYQAAADYLSPEVSKYGQDPMLIGSAYNAGQVYPSSTYSGGVGNDVWDMMMYASSSSSGYTYGSYDWKLAVGLNAVIAEIGGVQSPPAPTYSVTFTETGLPYNTTWTINFDGQTGSPYTYQSTSSSWKFTGIPDGSYSFSIPDVNGYVPNPASGTVSVSGSNVNVNIQFSQPPQYNPGDNVAVAVSSLNVRGGPGTGYSILAAESSGSTGVIGFGGKVSDNGYVWVSVTFGSIVGWAADEFMTDNGPSGYYTSSENFWPSAEVYVTASALYVHSGPGTSYEDLGLVDNGQTGYVEFGGLVDNNGYVWAPAVFTNNVIGWVAMNYLSPTPSTFSSQSPTQGYYYTVQSGDSLWGIAYDAYGNGNLYYLVEDANGLSSGTIYVGEYLYVPYLGE